MGVGGLNEFSFMTATVRVLCAAVRPPQHGNHPLYTDKTADTRSVTSSERICVLIARSKSILSTLQPPILDKYWDLVPGTATKLRMAALGTTPGQVEMSRPDSI